MKKHRFLDLVFTIARIRNKKRRLLPLLRISDPELNEFMYSWLGFSGWIRPTSIIDK